eukprot:272526_1
MSKKVLVYGIIREIISDDNIFQQVDEIIFRLTWKYYCQGKKKIKGTKRLKNCFFVYGTLRDDIYRNRKTRSTKKSGWSVGATKVNLGIIYGFKMYGIDSFPYAVKTNNTKDFMIGRLICFKNDKKFNKKLIISDEIEGYDPNESNVSKNIYIRKKVECFMFDKLNDKKLEEIGYFETNKRIDFEKSNISKSKQNAYIYYVKNKKKMRNSEQKTPNNDWLKRFEHHHYDVITVNID